LLLLLGLGLRLGLGLSLCLCLLLLGWLYLWRLGTRLLLLLLWLLRRRRRPDRCLARLLLLLARLGDVLLLLVLLSLATLLDLRYQHPGELDDLHPGGVLVGAPGRGAVGLVPQPPQALLVFVLLVLAQHGQIPDLLRLIHRGPLRLLLLLLWWSRARLALRLALLALGGIHDGRLTNPQVNGRKG